MAAPQAPLPLRSQIVNSNTITVVAQLVALDRQLNNNAAGPFNVGNPNATFIIAGGVSASGSPITSNAQQELCDLLDRLVREGVATVS